MLGNLSPDIRRVLDLLARLRRTLFRYFLAWLALFAGLTTVPIRGPRAAFDVAGWLGNSAASWLLVTVERSLLTRGETLIVVAPFDPLIAITEIGAFFAGLAVGTFALVRFVHYAWPALRPHERPWVRRLLAVAPGLFVAGCTVGFLVLPYVYLWAYQLAGYAGAAPTISLTEFVSTTLVFVVSVGLSFEIPVLIVGLTAAGIVSCASLRQHWRVAVFGCWVAAFVISPGVGGGWIEIPLGLGLSGLFYAGYAMAKRVERGRARGAERFGSDDTGRAVA